MALHTNRKEVFFTGDEMKLITFASKVYGLDKTATIRTLIRKSIIDLIIEWKKNRVPRLPADIEKVIDEF